MADEAVLIVETELPIAFTCAEGTAIEKGEILKMADLATVSKAAATNAIVGGIAGTEKISGDGMVRLDVYRGGIFKVKASGSISVGDTLGTTITNEIVSNTITVPLSGSRIIGTSLEDATDGHTFLMELRPQINAGIA